MKKAKEYIICSLLAILIGIQLGFVCGFFGRILEFIEPYRDAHYIYLVPFMGIAGVVIIFMYKRFSPNSEQGLNLAISYNMGEVGEKGEIRHDGHAHIGTYPSEYVILKLLANSIMLLFGASTGKEGTVATCGAAIGDYTSRIFHCRNYFRTLLITGVAAAVAGLFQTPLGGIFFALEFSAAGLLYYQALLPAIIAAYTSYYISTVCGFTAFHHTVAAIPTPGGWQLFLILVCAVLFGLIGRLFVFCLEGAKKLYAKKVKNRYLGILIIGSITAVFLIFILGGRYCGTGSKLVDGLLMGEPYYVFDFALKFIFTIVCIVIGFSGGEMMPIMSIGAALGAAVSLVTGLPFELMVVLGCVSVYSSATNTLLAPIFIGIEMFGTNIALYIAAACAIAFALNGNHSVYTRQGHITRSLYSTIRNTNSE